MRAELDQMKSIRDSRDASEERADDDTTRDDTGCNSKAGDETEDFRDSNNNESPDTINGDSYENLNE